jgi:hypothetical protein
MVQRANAAHLSGGLVFLFDLFEKSGGNIRALIIKDRELIQRRAEQSLAADGAIACFSSSFLFRGLNADRAPQLKAVVGRYIVTSLHRTSEP